MKIRRLELLRYGHLSDVALDFSDSAALHVVLGANEAGKSTALAAIADALFGFGHRTAFDFLHGGPQLRVGITLAAQDGSEARFVRRKGRGDTLRDAANESVPDLVLRRFLGGASRELFERSFGLDGTRLREGGAALLSSGGEAGESLLASTGLRNLHSALAALDKEADSLVGDRRGKRLLSVAVNAWDAARRETDERLVRPTAWREAEQAHADAVAALAKVQDTARSLSAENNRLQRMRRVGPILVGLDNARETLAPLADAPHLPADVATRQHDAGIKKLKAADTIARETADAARLTAQHASLPQDAAVLAAQDRIDALDARLPVVREALRDLPGVRDKVAQWRNTVAQACEVLGIPLAPEAARDAVPETRARNRVQQLIRDHAALDERVAAAAKNLEAAERRRDRAVLDLQAASAPPSPVLLRKSIDDARAQGPLDDDLADAARVLRDAAAASAAALAALPLWRGDMASLRACPEPLPATVNDVAARLEGARQAGETMQAKADQHSDEMAGLAAELSHIARGETVPTPDAVASARAVRDRVWRLLRQTFDGGAPPEAAERAGLPAGPLPEVFEAVRDAADRLADQRADDAQRVADYLAAQARLDHLRGQREAVDAALAAAEAGASAALKDWHALWAPAGVVPEGPAAMTEWRRARAEALRLADAEIAAHRQHDARAARSDAAREALSAALPPADAAGPQTLAALLRRAEIVCDAAEADLAAHCRAADTLALADAQLPDLRDAVYGASSALEDWRMRWSAAVAMLGLPGDAAVDRATASLDAWARIAEAAPAWQGDETRIVAMDNTITAFTADVRDVQIALVDAATDEAAPLVAARLVRRLATVRAAAAEAAGLSQRIAEHTEKSTQAAHDLRDADTALAELRTLAGVADDPALERTIERARQRDEVVTAITRSEHDLLAQGDGLLEAALREEATAIGLDPDAAQARVSDIEAELALLGTERDTHTAQRTRAEATLTTMRQGHDAAAKAQEAADALAEARAVAERYARVHVARKLLQAGIEKFRAEQQGPLLRTAGAHLARLTGGRYARLSVAENEAGQSILLAMRGDDPGCPVEGLSEGTRDQLYFALRLATIEAHVAHTEPLPFIADDLLVHFDDTRATAAIALLAELGRYTQVILFTHHDHIAVLAARQAGVLVQRLPGNA